MCQPRNRETVAVAVDWFGRAIGAGGLLVAAWTAFIQQRQGRLLRPMVLCEEVAAPHEMSAGGQLVARVRLSNTSDAAAYNLRLGVELHGARVSWGEELSNPPRLNKLSAGEETDPQDVLIPPGWAFERPANPWAERVYWVDYQDSADRWWTARNPWRGGEDLDVKLIGGKLRWWLHRWMQRRRETHALRKGARAAKRALRAAPPTERG